MVIKTATKNKKKNKKPTGSHGPGAGQSDESHRNICCSISWSLSYIYKYNINIIPLCWKTCDHEIPEIRGVSWNAPKSVWKMYFSREAICILFWNAPNSNNFIFGSFLVLKLVTCLFFEMPHFSVVKKFEMRHFTYLILEMGKMGHFKIFSYRKMGHFEKMTRD